jgi:DNA-binding MltR family transcriptional regulator
MSRKKSASRELRELAKQVPTEQQIYDTLNSLHFDTGHTADRSMAIIGSTVVERALEAAIAAKFVPLTNSELSELFGQSGPLSTFFGKIRVAYALNSIGVKTKSDLDIIRAVRNAFAHSLLEMRFDFPEIVALCNEFQVLALNAELLGNRALSRGDSKDKFVGTANYIAIRLRRLIDDPSARDTLP